MVINAKFFTSKKSKSKYDIIAINVDEYGLKHLQKGSPLRIAFYTDKKDHLPWYERDCMVIDIGLNINLNECQNNWKDRICKDGIIDKSYLKTSILEIRDNLIKLFTKELETIGVNTIPSSINENQKNFFNEKGFIAEFIGKKEASEILKISQSSLTTLANKKFIPGELDSIIGWRFIKKQIEIIYKNKPDFLESIYKNQLIRSSAK